MTPEELGLVKDWLPFDPSWKLIVWSLGLAFFGVFFAVPLRQEFIVKQKLKFPSGKATAMLIGIFHNSPVINDDAKVVTGSNLASSSSSSYQRLSNRNKFTVPVEPETYDIDDSSLGINPHETSELANDLLSATNNEQIYSKNITILIYTTLASSVYTLTSYFLPQIKSIDIFGSYLSKNYLLNFTPSPAYLGQGIIMGIETTTGMMIGMVLGWCILGPVAKANGWAPGEADDWKNGIAGWTMWIALGIMILDSLVSLSAMTFKWIYSTIKMSVLNKEFNETFSGDDSRPDSSSYNSINSSEAEGSDPHNDKSVPDWVPLLGLFMSIPCLLASMSLLFGETVPSYILLIMVPLSLIFSLLGVKALGETDLNPVSGIGKLSQLVTALILPKNSPGSILTNLVCGALAEATTQQAGDLMQDLKTGYMHNASPRAQLVAQLIGSLWSVLLSAPIWVWYNKLYEIPGKEFKIPTAFIWIDCARLVNGQGLPPMAAVFTLVASILTGCMALFKIVITEYIANETEQLEQMKKNESVDQFDLHSKEITINKVRSWSRWIPSGVAIGIGIYNSPSFTLARFLGGVISLIWSHHYGSDHINLIVFSSGLVLGEGMTSVVNMALNTWDVPHF